MNLRRSLNGAGFSVLQKQPIFGLDRSVLSEDSFHRVISLERKRTERSGKPFLLMLLDAGSRISGNQNTTVLTDIVSTLSFSTRETDVAGWYKSDSVVGVMFTEIGIEDRTSIVSTMLARVSATLRNSTRSVFHFTCSQRIGTIKCHVVPATPCFTLI